MNSRPGKDTQRPAHQMFLSGNIYTEGPCAQTLRQDSTSP